MNDIKRLPYKVIFSLGMHGKIRFLEDETYLKLMYYCVFGKKLNLTNPQTFNEKIQWLKLHDRNPLYTKLVDKYEVKKYVASIIGKEYIIPTFGIWDTFDEIEFNTLPNKFVLKCTHDSGGLVICKDKLKLDYQAAKRKIEHSLKKNYYWVGREWPYKDVKPRIIAEQYMEDSNKSELTDYKMMCFGGKVKMTFTCTNRFSSAGLKVTFYDTDWHMMPFRRYYPKENIPIAKPNSYKEMIKIAETLSSKIPFVRVDFYEVKGKLYFGELTFYPGTGMEPFSPSRWDKKVGDWIHLPDNMRTTEF